MKKFVNATDVVECMECHKYFKQITHTHLDNHNLSILEYRNKHSLCRGELHSKKTRISHQEKAIYMHKVGILDSKYISTKKLRGNGLKKILENPEKYKNIRSKTLKKYWSSMTPEERSKELSRRAKIAWGNPSKAKIACKKNLDRTGKIPWNKKTIKREGEK